MKDAISVRGVIPMSRVKELLELLHEPLHETNM
jgi:hypothetical protein